MPWEQVPAEKKEQFIALRAKRRRRVERLLLWNYVDGEMIRAQTKQFSKQVQGKKGAAEHNEVSQEFPGSGLYGESCRRAGEDARWC